MFSGCATVLFALGFVAVVSDTRELSDGAICTCNKLLFSSTLICTLVTPNDFVDVKSDYCGKHIKAVELQFPRNSYVSPSMLPDISIFRLQMTGPYLKKLSDSTFKGHEDSLRFVEIMQGAFTNVPARALQRLRRLESLNLAGNSIYSIDCSFKDKPLKNLILHDNKISLVHSCAFPQSLASLSLKNNFIVKLNGSLKQHHNLRLLFIQRNRITSLEGELEGLDSLSILHASWNRITTIGNEPVNLLGLRTLDLSHNRISELGGSLNGFTNLYSLDVSYNDLESLTAGMFDGLKNLITLSLSANSISSLDDGVFKPLAKLQSLTISNNVIVSLDGKLDGMRSLKKLDVSFNNIRIIDKAFTSLIALEELELQHTRISEFGNMLSTLSQLKSLDLSFNDLKEVNEHCFVGAKNLQKLNLSYNNIRPLNGTVFVSLMKLATLDLSYNQLQTLKALAVPGFMNITLTTEGTRETPDRCICKRTKTLVLTDTLSCMPVSEVTQMVTILRENDIEVVGC